MKLRTNDTVMVTKGRDRGKRGRISQTFHRQNKVLVEGVNMVFRHTKPTTAVRQAGIIQKELPIRVANIVLVCTQCNRPTRVGFRILADGTKARVCRNGNCAEVIE
jgi:large subunit ribosomal protein L24